MKPRAPPSQRAMLLRVVLRRTLLAALVIAAIVAAVVVLRPAPPPPPPHCVARHLRLEGHGAALTGAQPSVAEARREAERAAKLDALQRMESTLAALPLSNGKTAGAVLPAGDVQDLAMRFKIVDTRYYSDGSVDVVIDDNGAVDAIDQTLAPLYVVDSVIQKIPPSFDR